MMKADKYVELVVESFDNEESKAPRAPTPAREIEEEKKEASRIGNASPQAIFQIANELELHTDFENEYMRPSNYDSSSVVASDFNDISFTTNEDRSRRPSMMSNRESVVSHAQNQTTQRPKKKKFDHIQSKIKSYITQDKNKTNPLASSTKDIHQRNQSPQQPQIQTSTSTNQSMRVSSRQDTPVKMRDSGE